MYIIAILVWSCILVHTSIHVHVGRYCDNNILKMGSPVQRVELAERENFLIDSYVRYICSSERESHVTNDTRIITRFYIICKSLIRTDEVI